MTLLIEDGTGIVGANSYLAIAGADAYFATQGNAAWTAFNSTQKEAALLAGLLYIENSYRGRWKGFRSHQLQTLAWPRCNTAPILWNQIPAGMATPTFTYLTDLDGWPITANQIPAQVQNAQCEAAFLSITGFDFAKVSNAVIRGTSKTVDRVSYSEDYAGAQSKRDAKLVAIDRLLYGLIQSAPGATFSVSRVTRN